MKDYALSKERIAELEKFHRIGCRIKSDMTSHWLLFIVTVHGVKNAFLTQKSSFSLLQTHGFRSFSCILHIKGFSNAVFGTVSMFRPRERLLFIFNLRNLCNRWTKKMTNKPNFNSTENTLTPYFIRSKTSSLKPVLEKNKPNFNLQFIISNIQSHHAI